MAAEGWAENTDRKGLFLASPLLFSLPPSVAESHWHLLCHPAELQRLPPSRASDFTSHIAGWCPKSLPKADRRLLMA